MKGKFGRDAFWLAAGLVVSFVLVALASFWSGLFRWVFKETAATSGLIFALIFGVVIFGAAYVIKKRDDF
jgi:uncharacterized membrane protein YhaH (DUF805 family)